MANDNYPTKDNRRRDPRPDYSKDKWRRKRTKSESTEASLVQPGIEDKVEESTGDGVVPKPSPNRSYPMYTEDDFLKEINEASMGMLPRKAEKRYKDGTR